MCFKIKKKTVKTRQILRPYQCYFAYIEKIALYNYFVSLLVTGFILIDTMLRMRIINSSQLETSDVRSLVLFDWFLLPLHCFHIDEEND